MCWVMCLYQVEVAECYPSLITRLGLFQKCETEKYIFVFAL